MIPQVGSADCGSGSSSSSGGGIELETSDVGERVRQTGREKDSVEVKLSSQLHIPVLVLVITCFAVAGGAWWDEW